MVGCSTWSQIIRVYLKIMRDRSWNCSLENVLPSCLGEACQPLNQLLVSYLLAGSSFSRYQRDYYRNNYISHHLFSFSHWCFPRINRPGRVK